MTLDILLENEECGLRFGRVKDNYSADTFIILFEGEQVYNATRFPEWEFEAAFAFYCGAVKMGEKLKNQK